MIHDRMIINILSKCGDTVIATCIPFLLLLRSLLMIHDIMIINILSKCGDTVIATCIPFLLLLWDVCHVAMSKIIAP